MGRKKKNNTTNDKTVSLHPLSSDEALKALLETKPDQVVWAGW
jgi:hypothetical protein